MSLPENPTTKERIFIAAVRLFAREGYKGATARDICKAAGTANATALNYYFGGKAKLYKAVLHMIFAENNKRRTQLEAEPASQGKSPEERLRRYLDVMIQVGFNDEPLSRDAVVIVLREMMFPSPQLDEIVQAHTRADSLELMAILADLLGSGAPDYVVRDCAASVAGQVFYYMAFWPAFSRIYPEHPGVAAYRETLVAHIMRFSLAGLDAMRRDLEKGVIPPQQPQ